MTSPIGNLNFTNINNMEKREATKLRAQAQQNPGTAEAKVALGTANVLDQTTSTGGATITVDSFKASLTAEVSPDNMNKLLNSEVYKLAASDGFIDETEFTQLVSLLTGAPTEAAPADAAPTGLPMAVGTTDSDYPQQGVGGKPGSVRQLQTDLQTLGYFKFEGGPTGGYFNATAQAVKSFQTDNKLPPTGEVDQATLAAIQNAAKPGATDGVAAPTAEGIAKRKAELETQLTANAGQPVSINLDHDLPLQDQQRELNVIASALATPEGAAGLKTVKNIVCGYNEGDPATMLSDNTILGLSLPHGSSGDRDAAQLQFIKDVGARALGTAGTTPADWAGSPIVVAAPPGVPSAATPPVGWAGEGAPPVGWPSADATPTGWYGDAAPPVATTIPPTTVTSPDSISLQALAQRVQDKIRAHNPNATVDTSTNYMSEADMKRELLTLEAVVDDPANDALWENFDTINFDGDMGLAEDADASNFVRSDRSTRTLTIVEGRRWYNSEAALLDIELSKQKQAMRALAAYVKANPTTVDVP